MPENTKSQDTQPKNISTVVTESDFYGSLFDNEVPNYWETVTLTNVIAVYVHGFIDIGHFGPEDQRFDDYCYTNLFKIYLQYSDGHEVIKHFLGKTHHPAYMWAADKNIQMSELQDEFNHSVRIIFEDEITVPTEFDTKWGSYTLEELAALLEDANKKYKEKDANSEKVESKIKNLLKRIKQNTTKE